MVLNVLVCGQIISYLPDFLVYTYFAVSFLMIYINPQVTTTDTHTF